MDGLFGFLVLLGMSVFCWLMVLKPSFRRSKNDPAYYFWRLNKQGRRDLEGMYVAASVVGAMFFSLVTLVWLIVGVYRFFSH